MTLKKKHCLLLLAVILVLLISITNVSATDTNNTTQVVQDNNKLSTPANYDVDNVVQSDLKTLKSDADVEEISDTSNTIKNKDIQENTATNNKTIEKSNKTIKQLTTTTVTTFQQLRTALQSSGDNEVVINLGSNITISSSVTLNSNIKKLTINGNSYTLSNYNYGFLRATYSSNITLENINFYRVSQPVYHTSGNLTIRNCNFTNITSTYLSGGVIYHTGGNLEVTGSRFENVNVSTTYNSYGYGSSIYHSNGNASIIGSKFINNTLNVSGTNGYGLSIYHIGQGSLLVEDSLFINGTTSGSGQIAYQGSDNLTVRRVNFTNNYAQRSGAAIYTKQDAYVDNCTFINNSVKMFRGAAFYLDDSNSHKVILNNSLFVNSTSSAGGAVFITNAQAVVDNCSFIGGNSVDWNGGGIRQYFGNLTVLNSNFVNNTANVSGGAISFDESSSESYLVVNNSNFTNNFAKGNGGAVDHRKGNTTISNSIFTNNRSNIALTSQKYGGAVYKQSDNLTINNVTFINNTASCGSAIGGGFDAIINNSKFIDNLASNGTVYTTGDNVSINGSIFDNNNATLGGGIYMNYGNLIVNSTNASNNNASVRGGVIFLQSGNLNVSDSNFTNNTATEHGGAIFHNDGDERIVNSSFTKNGVNMTGEVAQAGGGAIYKQYGDMEVINSTFTENYLYSSYPSTGGAAIYKQRGNLLINGSNFTKNNATTEGAAIYHSASTLLIDSSNFTENVATNASVICQKDGTITNITNSTFKNNKAENDAGVIYNTKGTLYINSSEISSNTAGVNAGALYVNDGKTTIENSNITDNTALTGGFIVTKSAFESTNNSIGNNKATTGGVIYLNSTTSSLKSNHDVVENNSAVNGALIYSYSGISEIDNAIINNNTASGNGTIFNSNSARLTLTNSNATNNTADKGAVVYNSKGATSIITNNNIINNTAVEGAVLCNNGTSSVSNNNITSNKVTGAEYFVIDNIDTLTLSNNNFTNNTDNTRDMLLDSKNDKITVSGNTYVGNYLNITIDAQNVTAYGHDGINTLVPLTLRTIYNDLVRNGNITVTIGDYVYVAEVADGKATIVIPDSIIARNQANEVQLSYKSPDYSYQEVETTFNVDTYINTSITIDVNGNYEVNSPITYTVTLKDADDEVMGSTSINITLNGVTQEYTTTSEGTVTITVTYPSYGNRLIRAEYMGDEYHNYSVSELRHPVNKIDTDITIVTQNTGSAPMDNVPIEVTLTDKYGNVIPDKTVVVKLLNNSIEVTRFTLTTDENGAAQCEFTPQFAANYEVEATFNGELDEVYYSTVTKQNILVEKITPVIILRNTTEIYEQEANTFKIFLTGRGENIVDAPLNIIVTLEDGTVLTFTNPKTDANGEYEFSFNRNTKYDAFTVTVSYPGNERYYSNSFAKPFDRQKMIIYQNITATDTFINQTNTISIEVKDEWDNGLNGTFEVSYLNGTIIGTAEVKDGFGYYTDFKSEVYIPELIVNGRFINDSYISVVESVPFKVMKLEPNINVEAILNETVYNTTLKINVFNPDNASSIVHDGRLVIKHLDDVVGEAEVVDGYAVVTLNGVDRNRFYALTIDYLGNDYFRGRESQTRVEPQKLPVELAVTELNNTVGNISLRIDVTSQHDPSVNNGTVYLVRDGTEQVIAQGQVQGGVVILNVSSEYFTVAGEYPIDFKYSDSLTFLDNDLDYDLIINPRPTRVEPTKNNTVVNEATIDVVLRDATTNELLADSDITVYDLHGLKIANGKTDENGFVTIPINLPVGEHDLIIKYSGNKTYLESSAPLLMNVDYRNATITPEILDTVTDNVTIKATFTDTDNGNPITSGDVAILYKDGEPIAQTILDNDDGQVIFEGLHLPVGQQNLEIRLLSDGIYNQTSKFITVDVQYRNLTIDFEQVNKYVTEATINVTLKDKDTGKLIEANIIIYDENGYVVGRGNTEFDELFVNLPAGKYNITVEYPEDGIYNKTNLTKEIDIIKRDTEIRLNLNRRNLILSEIISIDGRLLDADLNRIVNATVNLYIDNVPAAILKTNEVGAYFYEYTTDKVGTDLMVNVIYEGSNIYNPSSNNRSFNVSKIPTKTNVEVLNSTIGNVTLKINVTNMTDELLTNGRVIVRNASDYNDILGTGHLLNGVTTIKLDVDTTGFLRFNVTYLGDDKYLESNAINTTDDVTSEDINIFTVDVQKQNSTITINVREYELTIGESVIIYGNVFDENNRIISTGTVNVMVNNTVYPVELINGLYILRNVTGSAGLFNANATYTGSTNISECTSDNITYTVNKINTTTNVEILNNTVGNVTIEITVTNSTGTPVISGSVNVVFNNGTAIETGKDLIDGKVIVVIPSDNLEDLQVNVTYLGDDTYLASNATNSTATDEDMKNTTVINVEKQDATITIELNDDNVTIGETVTITGQVRDANGVPVTSGSVTVLVGGVQQPVTFENGAYTVKNVTVSAGTFVVNATYTNEDGYYNRVTSENKTFTVNKIPTKTIVEVVNTTFGNVTIRVNVTNTTNTPKTVTQGTIHVIDSLGNTIATQTAIEGESVLINLTGITDVGITQIGVYYDENNVYLASNAKNESAIGQNNENLITINVTKIPTTISKVEILSNLSNNITLNISVTNTTETPTGVTTGTVVVYDTQGNELARGNVDNVGNVTISVPNEDTDKLEVVIKYIENDLYLNSTAINSTAAEDRQNITVIPIDKIPTITTAAIVNNTIGNVVINVNVTNTSSQPVTTGHVVVRDQSGTIIGEGDLVNGGVNITLNVNTPGQLKVNITYQENNIYYSSNAQNSSLTDEDANKNITNIEVAKLGSIVTIITDKNSVTIGESVLVYGTVVDSEGKIIKDGQVQVTINGTDTLVNVVNGTYNTTYVTNIAGEIIANATYIPADGSNISKNTSENTTFTVNKIPTTTTVEILNNTIGNVTIEITVTNATGTPVISGKVSVVTKNGSVIEAGKALVDGKVIVEIPTTNLEDLKVNVTYLGDDTYLPSNATNSTADEDMKNTTVINVTKQDATITINLEPTDVKIGETVTITGQVLDANKNPVTTGNVTVQVGGVEQPVTFENGAYTVNNVTISAGSFTVNATYTTEEGFYNSVTSENKKFTVNKLPTTTTVEVLNNTVNNVTINVTVKDENNTIIDSGIVNVTVAGVSTPVDIRDIPIRLNITSPGNFTVSVDYAGDDTYLPSQGLNSSGEVFNNIIVEAQTAKINITVNTTNAVIGDNISISGCLVNATEYPIANAIVTITVNGTNYTAITDDDGNYAISVIADKLGEVIANATYNTNPVYNNATSTNVSYIVGMIPTKTNVVEIVNNSLGNVVIKVNVTNNTNDLVPTGHVVAIDATSGNTLGEADLTNGIANITLTGIIDAGVAKVNVTFIGNEVYLPSNATGNSQVPGEENTTTIRVVGSPTITMDLDKNNVLIGEEVTINVNVTDDLGESISTGTVTVTIGDTPYTATYNKDTKNWTVTYTPEKADELIVNATFTNETTIINTDNDTLTVNKLPTTTTVEVLNNTVNNVTISVVVKDENGTPITSGVLNITVAGVTTPVTFTDATPIKLNITSPGNFTVSVDYAGDDTYLPSQGLNSSSEVFNNIIVEAQTAKINITANTTNAVIGDNISISGCLVNATDNPIANAIVTVTVNGTNYTAITDIDGNYAISVIADKLGTVIANATYNTNPVYNNITSTNVSYVVGMIPTKTNIVEIVDNSLGNVVLRVNVTNNTGDLVPTGHVVAIDAISGNTIGEADLTNGIANITLTGISESGEAKVNVTFIGNEVYLPSNATGNSQVPGEENTTTIRVVGSPTITMDLDKNNVLIGEEVTINVNVTDDLGESISTGTVTVTIGDTPYTATYNKDTKNWTVTYTPEKADELIVNATFTNETTIINTDNDTLTVNKLPTTTTVEVLNNTVNNVTISVVVKDENGTPITSGVLNITVAGVTTPVTFTDATPIKLNITSPGNFTVSVDYAGDDTYLPSQGLNSSSEVFNNIIVEAQTAKINITANTTNAVIGDNISISGCLVNATDNPIANAIVTVTVNGTNYTAITDIDGNYAISVIADKLGTVIANATYNTNPVYNNITSTNVSYVVGMIPTKTNIVEIVDNSLGNVVLRVNVTNNTGDLVPTGHVVAIDAISGNTIGEADLTNGIANITLTGISESGEAKVNVTFIGNEVYLPSNATGNSQVPGEENTTIIRVVGSPTITMDLDKNNVSIGEEVTINVNVTDDLGNAISTGTVTVTIDDTPYTATYDEDSQNWTVTYTPEKAGQFIVNATFTNDTATINTDNDTLTVNKLPTTTTVVVLNNTVNNVTISVVVKDENNTPITSGVLNITVAGVTTPVTFTDATPIKLNITSPGDITVKVDYLGNDTYLPSEGINSDNGEVLENITTIAQTAKITIATNATENNIISDNITINGTLTNATDNPIANAIVTVTVNGTNYTAITDNDGNYAISVIADKLGEVIANATYNTNPSYNNITSTNVSYIVGMIPTKTNVVEIVDNSLGNVVLKVNVTNNTGDLVPTGHVVAIDATSGNILGEADLTNGIANITLTGISESGEVKVNVTFTGTDVYLPSNATGNSSITGEENTTVFTVLEEPTITLTIDPDTYKVGEVVPIFVDITNKTGKVPTDADVTVTINDDDYTAVYNETTGNYVVQYNDAKADIYNVTASYKVDEETTIDSDEDSFTVEKLPTTTTVELLDNTVGNVTIRVTVVGNGSTIREGQLNITVGGKTQTETINDTGVTTIKLDIDVVDDVPVSVIYNGSEVFLPSNGTDTQGRDFVNITTKERTSIISIVAEPNEGVIIGDNVTISGNLTDNLGNNITDAYVDLYINDSYVATIRTDNNGAYTYTYTPESTGNVNVSVRYLGTVEINGTENSTVFSVGKIATTTKAVVTDVNVNNITVDVTVVDVRGDNVVNGTVVIVDADTGDVLGEATITDGKATIKLNIDDSGDARINVTYTENDVYLPSNATGNSSITGEENTTVFTVLEEPTIILTIDPDTYKVGEVVPIFVDITNKTGKVPTDADVTVTINDDDYTAVYNETTGNYVVQYNDAKADIYNVTASYKVDEETTIDSDEDSFTVEKLPTTTTVEILNNTANNVTISVVVKDENGTALSSGKLNITVAGTTTSVDFTDATPIKLNITSPGDIAVKVDYLGNDTYLPSQGINSDNGEVLENITTIAQTAKITIATNATENNIIGDNITINGTLTNATDNPIANAIVTITVNGTNYTATTDSEGNYAISVIADKLGEVIANATYNTNPSYNNITSTNVSYIVGMIPTKTNIVEIVDNSLGNVVLKVNVTNNTGDLVPTGHVVAIDATSGNTIGEADLTNGIANITLTGITDSGEVKVNVTFTGTDVYLPSNATGNSQVPGEENTTTFTVLEEPTITLTIDPDTYKVGEVVPIFVDITNKTGEVPTDADVTVTINDDDYTAVYNETTGKYVVQYNDTKAGIYNVTASYKVDEETTINSDEDSFTVEKLPTITTVEILNNTVGNVTVKVSVTNDTDNAPVTKGKISITDLNGNLLTDATLIDGSIDITIPTTNAGDLRVIVSYDENDIYLPSNATNSSSTGSISEDITLIDVQKQDANINISSNTSIAVIDDKVTINGTVTDGMNQPITDGTVTVTIGNDSYTVDLDENGAYTLEYNATKAGEFIVNATYNGIDDVINPVTSENLDLTVIKKTPVVNVTQTNTTPDNTTLVIDVTDNEGNPVPEGNVTIALPNGTNITVPVKDGVANVTLDLPVGENDVNVTFEENDEYSSVTIPEVVKTNKLNTTITVDDIDDVTIGENITIKGVLTDEYGRIMPNTNVNITINDDKYHTTTDANGAYAFDYQTATSGVHNVTVDYTGNQTHNPSTNATSFNVDKKTAVVNVTQTNSTPDNTTLVIDVTDSEGNPVPEGNVTIALPNGTNVTVPVKDGVANVTLDLPVGENDVNVTFEENDEYSSVTIPEVVKTNKLNTTITVDDIDDVTIGENITIKGILTDEYGRIMPNTNVNITVNNEKLTTRTDTSGKYSITYKPTKAQSYNVTVAYLGNATHNPSNNKTTFTVNKIPTNTTVTILNNTVGNVKINVKVTNTTNNPVTKGSVKVTDMYGKQVATANLNGGNANITIPTTTAGDLRVIVSYNENDIYLPSNATNSSAAKTPSENITLIDVEKLDAKITINTNTTKATIGDKVTINGTVKDQNNKLIPNGTVTVKVGNDSYTVDLKDGVYKVEYNATKDGKFTINATYNGQDNVINPVTSENKSLTVTKKTPVITVKQDGNKVENTTLKVNITDKNGTPIQNGTVTVKDPTGKTIATVPVTNGQATIPVDLPAGTQNLTVTYNGNEEYTPINKTQKTSITKTNAILTINPIQNITFYQKTDITGRLADVDGNPIRNAKVTLDIDGVTQTVTTDKFGEYTLGYNTTKVGLNNVTAKYSGDTKYNNATAKATFNASKIITYVTVADVKGTIGDNVTLKATVTDEYGTRITGGQFVFKINGLTLRTNGKFEKNGTPMILSPVNGQVNITIKADKYLRSAVNVTGVYGETYKYYGSRSITPGKASIARRNASITVTTVSTTKQDVNITLKATVTDITHGKNNGPVQDYEDNFVIFKVNGITIKNDDGTAKQVKVVNGTATPDYHVPIGLAGKYTNLTDKKYTVTAVFGSGEYNPGVSNTTQFGVERSPITFKDTHVTLDTKTKHMYIKSDIVDYHDNLLKGTNNLCVKVNGESYKINNKTVYYSIQDGKVDLNIIVPYHLENIHNVGLVTGERVGYLSGRTTINDIVRV